MFSPLAGPSSAVAARKIPPGPGAVWPETDGDCDLGRTHIKIMKIMKIYICYRAKWVYTQLD
jgi:hypothetical protein